VDISGVIAESNALYALELLEPPPREPTPHLRLRKPRSSRVTDVSSDVNLATAQF
jgi:hypothetical protein